MSVILRRTVFAFVLGAALASAVLVGRAAFATTDTISACFKPSNGTLYLLGGTSGRTECQPGDIPISWNTAGVNGQDGVSVTSQALAPGDDPACPNGGSKFTAVNDVSYACNGSNGQDGLDGQNGLDGQDGQDFSGTFTSPNGLYRLVVDNTTAKLVGPTGKVEITGNSVQIQTQGLFSASGTVTSIGGTPILLNGSGCGLLRPTDVVPVIGPGGGSILLNPGGTANLRTSC
jgi:hypothetical protein